jgi:hypothetical protein
MDINHTDLEKLLKEDLESCDKEHDLLQIKSKYLGKKRISHCLIYNTKRH